VIIFLCDGQYSEKIVFLEKHINKYYTPDGIKEFITDWIEINTKYSLEHFKSITNEMRLSYSNMFKNERINELVEKLYHKYVDMKLKSIQDNSKKHNIANDWLMEVFDNLQGDKIRDYLREEYLKDNII
jgi:hypothetical protein